MAYLRPIVMVYQEYAKMSVSTQTATLVPCVVGPCYHLIDAEEDEILALVGTYTEAGFTDQRFPNNAPGALIEPTSIKLRFKNPIAQLFKDKAVSTVTANALVFASGVYPTGVTVGDRVTVYNEADPGNPAKLSTDFRVIGVNSNTRTVLLNKSVPAAVVAASVDINRQVPDFYVLESNEGVTVDETDESFSAVGIKATIAGTEYPVIHAETYVTYRALRQDLSDVGTVYNTDEAKARLGKLDPQNPLGYGVLITLANTNVGVKFVGVDSDDVLGFTAAKDRLETVEDVYAIAVLSQEPEILGMFKMHAEAMSKPEVGLWRVAIGSTKLATELKLQEGSCKISADGNGDRVVIKDLDANFLSSLCDAGQKLVIKGGDNVTYQYTIAAVVSEDTLTITQSTPFSATAFPVASPDATYTYTVIKTLDRSQQADYIGTTSKSYGSSRFVHVWPDVVEVDDQDLPGYYLACAVAGMTGGLAPHQGFTRISIGGIGGLKHSNNYFNQSQLDAIAEGGTFIFQQLTPGSAPYVRHQLTTDMSTTEMREFSFVKNFDYVSYICKDTMDAFLGKWNVNTVTLGVLETALRSVMESLKLYSLPRIGSPILGYEITSVIQLDDIRDRVEMYCEVDFPYPLNTIGLHIISR